jgi:hypothetical protein
MVEASLPDSSKVQSCGRPGNIPMSDGVFRIYLTLPLSGRQELKRARKKWAVACSLEWHLIRASMP